MHFDASLVNKNASGITNLCDFEGNHCVERVIALKSSDEGCGCLPSCNQDIYTYRLFVEDLQPKKFCSPGST